MARPALKLAVRSVIAGIALTALGLVAASPASAHTNNLFTYLDSGFVTNGFATMSRTDATVAPLPTTADVVDEVAGAEVFGEVGTAVGVIYGDPAIYYVFGWDHTTGAASPLVPLYVDGADQVNVVTGLDTLLDGTTITWVEYDVTEGGGEFPPTTTYSAIATVNKLTGELVPIIDTSALTVGDDAYGYTSLATDPISGVTYGFLNKANASYYVDLYPNTSSYGDATLLGGEGFESGDVLGADFDYDGILYFIYANNLAEQFELSTLGAPSTWPTAKRTYIGEAGNNYDGYPLANLALTLEHSALLASTGSGFPLVWLVAGSVAVLAGGITVMATRRRRHAG